MKLSGGRSLKNRVEIWVGSPPQLRKRTLKRNVLGLGVHPNREKEAGHSSLVTSIRKGTKVEDLLSFGTRA